MLDAYLVRLPLAQVIRVTTKQLTNAFYIHVPRKRKHAALLRENAVTARSPNDRNEFT